MTSKKSYYPPLLPRPMYCEVCFHKTVTEVDEYECDNCGHHTPYKPELPPQVYMFCEHCGEYVWAKREKKNIYQCIECERNDGFYERFACETLH